jgi:hypothetical protein
MPNIINSSRMFGLHDLSGAFKRGVMVNEVEVPKPVAEPTVSHHIVIVDRSGSMYGVMNDTKAMVEKVMVAEEFTGSDLLLTLISYSSKGDHTLHFARKRVAEVLDPKSGLVDQIRGIRATCLTSVSDALNEALNHVVLGETTAVSIHTDGYFNDRSPGDEAKQVDRWIKRVQVDYPAVYANTIAYGSWTDFKMLDRISQSLSGKTVVAKSVKQVHDALHDTSALLAGRVVPAIQVFREDSDFLAVHNITQRKVNGSATDLSVRGVGPDDETRLYRYVTASQDRWHAETKRTELVAGPDAAPAYVYARSLLAAGRLNEAKFVVSGLRDETLLRKHYKAITSEALAKFASDLERRIGGDFSDLVVSSNAGMATSAGSVMELCQALSRHKSDFTLDLAATLSGYQRRSVKRINGEWSGGVFVPSSTSLRPIDDETHVSVTEFEISNASATINMQLTRRASLLRSGSVVDKLAGRVLDVKDIRSYTVVSEGEINLSQLVLNIGSKRLHADLVAGGWLPDTAYDHTQKYVVDLTLLAACPFSRGVDMPAAGTFDRLLHLLVKRGLITASLGGSGKSDDWTAEQLEELKAHDLSASLNYNPRTTNPYVDRLTAISAGEVDTRTAYKVTLGDRRMVSSAALYSANEYLARRYSVKGSDPADCDKDGNLKKPKLTDVVGGAFGHKALSARTKLNPIDDLMFPMFEAFLDSGLDGISVRSDRDVLAAELTIAEEEIEAIYAERLRPMAMYIGATGLIPDGWDVVVLDAEGLKAKFPDVDVEKKQMDGTFLVAGDTVIGIFPEAVDFSTPKGVEVAKSLQGESAA